MVARKDEEHGGDTPLWLKVFEKLGAIESRLTGVETHLAEQNGNVKDHAKWISEQKGRGAFLRYLFEGGLVCFGLGLGAVGHTLGWW